MEQLLDGLLMFSRLSRQPLKRVDVEPSQCIVGRHGGRMWAEGAPGRGATFSFTLGRERVP